MLIKPIRTKKIVAVAMSGGVDSSVAAALLKKQGFQVFGLTMKTFCTTDFSATDTTDSRKICCGQDGVASAKQVCRILGIPHYTVDASKEFTKKVIEDFVSEYKAGRTPNPCVRCNQFIKFDLLLNLAKKMTTDPEAVPPLAGRYGAGFFTTDNTDVFLATGHYARVVRFPKSVGFRESNSQYHLLRGKDKNKDQSYFLYNLSQKQLSQIIFPLGDLKKEEVRNLARKFKLPVAEKPESQEICFINTNLSEFLSLRIKAKAGEIVDLSGKILGKHRGIAFYTIGQRAGVGGKGPYYVAKINKDKNQLVVTNNPKDPLILRMDIVVGRTSWVQGVFPKNKIIKIQVRYRSAPIFGKIKNLERGSVGVEFKKPVFAPAPGQSAVFYKGDECLGGGIIS